MLSNCFVSTVAYSAEVGAELVTLIHFYFSYLCEFVLFLTSMKGSLQGVLLLVNIGYLEVFGPMQLSGTHDGAGWNATPALPYLNDGCTQCECPQTHPLCFHF